MRYIGCLLVAGRVALFSLISSVAWMLIDVKLVNLLNTWLVILLNYSLVGWIGKRLRELAKTESRAKT